MPVFRYTRWDGKEDGLSFDAQALMDELSNELLTQPDMETALRSLLRHGIRHEGEVLSGIESLLDRLGGRRQELLETHTMSGVLGETRRRLAEIHDREAGALDHVQGPAHGENAVEGTSSDGETTLQNPLGTHGAQLRALESVPWQHPAQAIAALRAHDFATPEASELFDRLQRELQRQALEMVFNAGAEDLAGMVADPPTLRRALHEFNALLEDSRSSEYEDFLRRHGPLLGRSAPNNLSELVARLRRRSHEAESLLQSLNPLQRRVLRDLLDGAFSDAGMVEELRRLAAFLRRLERSSVAPPGYQFGGTQEAEVSEALQIMEALRAIEDAEQMLRRALQRGDPGGLDPGTIEATLGEAAAQEVQRLAGLTTQLEHDGYLRRVAGNHDGGGEAFELTPKGIRRIGHRALQEIFTVIRKDRLGAHASTPAGQGQEATGPTKVYEFGDPFLPDLQHSIFNAVLRNPGVPVRLQPEDIEVYRTEHLAQASTVLLIDLSLSMAMRGNFIAAKKVALALDNLIRTRFPRDRLFIVGFSTHARAMDSQQLAFLHWDEFEPYTNIQAGLAMAQKMLAQARGTNRQIIMVSDGEPTAHMEGAEVFLQYPPSPRTIRATLAQVRACTQENITINTFMLDRTQHLMDFVDQMTRLNRGRVFYTTADRLGKYVLVDYLTSRQQRRLA
jgi:uncharacterized protein with von Willebrand factor type A (vWA) domain